MYSRSVGRAHIAEAYGQTEPVYMQFTLCLHICLYY